jgi:P4 family phage/plasmid primase-like protien
MRDILYPLVIKLTSDYKSVADNDEGKILKKKIDVVLNLIKSCSNTKTASKCIPQISILLAKPENWAGETLNKARDILPVMNGVLELRTGNLRPYEMEDYLTYKIPIDYTPKAPVDNQIKFFNDVLHNDEEAIKYIHYFLGYCLTGETSLQKALILEGSEDGANGKSVLMDCMLAILGKDLYSTLNRKAITLTEGQNNDSLYDARFSRIVCIPEMNKNGNNIDEGLIKNITGDDEVNVSAKFKNNIRFHPQFKVCMPLNEMFAVPASSGAVWRRLIVMPFKVRFLSKDNPDWDDELADQKLILERDDKFAKELKADKEGWLNWLVQGSIKFYNNPDQEPPRSLQEHMIKIQEENDSYLSYINNAYKITGDKKDYILVNDMTKDYPNVEKDKEKVIQRRIGVAMKKLNIIKGTKDVYPTKRESSCEGGRWLSKEIEDTSLPSTKMKVWFGLRKKTEEDRQEE